MQTEDGDDGDGDDNKDNSGDKRNESRMNNTLFLKKDQII